MGSLVPPELTLDSSNKPWIPKSTGDFLAQLSSMDTVSDKLSKLDDYVNRLQQELKKIDAFKRELPLCMFLLNDAIATIRNEIMRCKNSNPGPILEEFIPLKKTSGDEKDEKIDDVKVKVTDIVNRREKMKWMSSVQLWNSDSNSKKRKEDGVDRSAIDELFRSGKSRALAKPFPSFKGCSDFPAMAIGREGRDEFPGAPSLSLRIPEIKNSTEEVFPTGLSSKSSSSRSGSSCGTNSQSSFKGESQTGRKQRRCWSPELHRRFVSALQQLGGAQAATPKQIRELMQAVTSLSFFFLSLICRPQVYILGRSTVEGVCEGMNKLRMEGCVRMACMFVLALTACLVGFDSQTKILFYTYAKKASFRDLNALYVLVWIDTAAAVYNLLQLFRISYSKDLPPSKYPCLPWAVYFLDQAAAYVVFAGNTAAFQGSMLAITGEKSFQWMKLCNKFTRFCFQIGGGLLCGYIAAVLMAITASISACSLFRLYSPKHFLSLKLKS